MLNEEKIAFLKRRNIIDIENIEDVDIENRIVSYKNGDKRQICEIWSRVMGYHRPIEDFNKGKLSEFNDRKYFKYKYDI